MSAPNEPPGRRGQAIVDLVTWLKSDATAKALEALQVLGLSEKDLELLFRNHAPDAVARIPFRGKVT